MSVLVFAALPVASLAAQARTAIGGSAGSDAAQVVGRLVGQGRLDEAAAKVEEYLAADPDDVDALMMKGNVILNRFLDAAGSGMTSLEVNSDESIFSDAMGYMKAKVVVVAPDTARAVAALWQRCLELAPDREDIHLGLCCLYSWALMKDELLARIVILASAFPGDKDRYATTDYVRNIAERGDLAMFLEVARGLLAIYPERSGLMSDVASFLASAGRLDEAEPLIDRAFAMEDRDSYVCGNYHYLHYVLGDYDKALAGLKADPKKASLATLFEALLRYSRGEEGWREGLAAFLQKPGTSKQARTGKALATFLLSAGNAGDYASYLESIDDECSTYSLLLVRRAMELFPREAGPRLRYGYSMAQEKNYGEAIRVLDPAFFAEADDEERESAELCRAWSLQDSGRTGEADTLWAALLSAPDEGTRNAAAWFHGKNLLAAGDRDGAIAAFSIAGPKEDASKGKYATYCWNMLERIGKR